LPAINSNLRRPEAPAARLTDQGYQRGIGLAVDRGRADRYPERGLTVGLADNALDAVAPGTRDQPHGQAHPFRRNG
jgi:hypothetical protein